MEAGTIPLTPEDRAILDLESPRVAGHTCKVIVLAEGGLGLGALRDEVARALLADRGGGAAPTAEAMSRRIPPCAPCSRRRGSVDAEGRHRARDQAGTGELEGVTYETIIYEGYATNGVAVYVEALSDNRNRTGAEIKNIFTRNGGSARRTRRGRVAVRAQGRDHPREVGRVRGRPDARRARRRCRRHRRPRRQWQVTTAARPTCTRCAPRSRKPGSR